MRLKSSYSCSTHSNKSDWLKATMKEKKKKKKNGDETQVCGFKLCLGNIYIYIVVPWPF